MKHKLMKMNSTAYRQIKVKIYKSGSLKTSQNLLDLFMNEIPKAEIQNENFRFQYFILPDFLYNIDQLEKINTVTNST